MPSQIRFLSGLFLILSMALQSQPIALPKKPFTQTAFGIPVVDSYRYMEGSNDTLVKRWYQQNGAEARQLLNSIKGRNEFVQSFIEFEKRHTFDITLLNITADDRYFFVKKEEANAAGKLYVRKGKSGENQLLFDPANYGKGNGKKYNINYVKPSWSGNRIALGMSTNGEETGDIVFFDLKTGKLLPQIITNAWPAELGIDWLTDDSGIVYTHIPTVDTADPNYILNTEMVAYRLGDDPQKHRILFSKKNNPEIAITAADFPLLGDLNPKDSHVLGSLSGAALYLDYYFATRAEFQSQKIKWKPLYKKEDGLRRPQLVGQWVYCLSSKNSSNYKIIRTPIASPDFNKAETIVPESKEEVINSYLVTKDGLFHSTTKNGVEAKLYFTKDGETRLISLPIKAGSISLSCKDKYESDLWVTIKGWLNPETRYRYDVATDTFTPENMSISDSFPEFSDFTVNEIEIPSHDGVLVPVTMIHKKGLDKNKNNLVLFYGYGSYGYAIKPNFQPMMLSWVLHDGVLVIPHVRGGGEKGADWHNAGYKNNKPNTWKDLIATAEYLIRENISNPDKMALLSGSAGAILVGRAMTERPDLFRVMMCYSGLLNPLRINESPNGPNNMKELGNPEIESEFKNLLGMDPYLQIKDNINYPACLISTGMNDARVTPWMSGKFVARLRDASVSGHPVCFVVDYESGHGADNTKLQLYNDYADEFAFAFWQMGHPDFTLKGQSLPKN